MALLDKNMYEKVATKVGPLGSREDTDTIVNILNLLTKIYIEHGEERKFKYDLRPINDNCDAYVLEWTKGLPTLDNVDIERLVTSFPRIRSITVDMARSRLNMIVGAFARDSSAPTSVEHVVASLNKFRKRRRGAFDWLSARVSDNDDRTIIEAIVDDVYAIDEFVPNMHPTIEPIVDKRTRYDAIGGDDSTEDDSRAPEGARIGYSLYFDNVPSFDARLLNVLRTRHANVVSVRVQFAADNDSPAMLVVNIQRPNELPATDHSGIAMVKTFEPKLLAAVGGPSRKRRRQ